MTSEVRAAILQAARAEIGAGRPDVYWQDVLGPRHFGSHPPEWCGAFALWCIRQSGVAQDVLWTVGKGFLYELRPAKNGGEPGDVAYFAHFQHHALVTSVIGEQVFTVDGNTPGVKECVHATKLATIFSIAPWIPDDG